jgi:hypothetical protein
MHIFCNAVRLQRIESTELEVKKVATKHNKKQNNAVINPQTAAGSSLPSSCCELLRNCCGCCQTNRYRTVGRYCCDCCGATSCSCGTSLRLLNASCGCCRNCWGCWAYCCWGCWAYCWWAGHAAARAGRGRTRCDWAYCGTYGDGVEAAAGAVAAHTGGDCEETPTGGSQLEGGSREEAPQQVHYDNLSTRQEKIETTVENGHW